MFKIKKLFQTKSNEKELDDNRQDMKNNTSADNSIQKELINNQITYKVVEKNPVPNFDAAIKVEQHALGIQPYHVREHSIVKPTDKEPSIFKLLHDKLSKSHRNDESVKKDKLKK